MKRWLLLLGLCAAPGCVELDVWLKDKQAAEPSPAAEPAMTRVRIQVNPGDVTESNAPEMLRALREEIDRAATEPRTTPPAPR